MIIWFFVVSLAKPALVERLVYVISNQFDMNNDDKFVWYSRQSPILLTGCRYHCSALQIFCMKNSRAGGLSILQLVVSEPPVWPSDRESV
jgi:hypothetical protein